jgi:hypothetical protein
MLGLILGVELVQDIMEPMEVIIPQFLQMLVYWLWLVLVRAAGELLELREPMEAD